MIDHKRKFIYIHIDKTGGTSIASALKPKIKKKLSCKGPMFTYHDIGGKHWPIERYGDSKYEKYFKFAFVRNPWDRAVSKYFFDRRFRRKDISLSSFRNWVGRTRLKPQLDYVTIDNKIVVDFIGKFENLQEGMDEVCDRLNIQTQELPHANKTTHKHYSKYYDKETRESIAQKYAKDIDYFGYKFGE